MSSFMFVLLVLAIVGGTIIYLVNGSRRAAGQANDAALDDMRGEIEALRKRVAVLEKINTDPSERLKRELEDL